MHLKRKKWEEVAEILLGSPGEVKHYGLWKKAVCEGVELGVNKFGRFDVIVRVIIEGKKKPYSTSVFNWRAHPTFTRGFAKMPAVYEERIVQKFTKFTEAIRRRSRQGKVRPDLSGKTTDKNYQAPSGKVELIENRGVVSLWRFKNRNQPSLIAVYNNRKRVVISVSKEPPGDDR